MNKPPVLYLSYDGLTDPLGQSQVLPYLCGLAATYSISIISFEKVDRFEREAATIRKICSHHSLQWHPFTYHKVPPIFSTLYDLMKMRKMASKLQQIYSFKIVHCRSYLPSLVGVWLKKKYGVRFIFDMRGFWPDERVEGGLWNLKNPVFKSVYFFFKRKEQLFLDESDYTVVLTKAASRQLNSWNMQKPVKIIPCCVDLDFFDHSSISTELKRELEAQLGIKEGDYILGYIGSLGTWYLYDEMVSFFDCLKKFKPSSRMLFLTPDLDRVERRADFIVKTVSRREMPAYLSLCDISVCFIQPSFSKQGSSATKMAEALAMGIPIVVNSGWGDAEEVVRESQCGIVIKSWNTEDMENIARNLLSKTFSPDYIRRVAIDYFSLSTGIKDYGEIYNVLSQPVK